MGLVFSGHLNDQFTQRGNYNDRMANASNISLRGVRVHNLRGIDVEIPLGKLSAVTGVSGAGKSSLVFDTIYAEAQRRYLQSFSVAIRQQLERFDQPEADCIGDLPAAVAVRRRNYVVNRATVGSVTELSDWLRLLLVRAGTMYCPNCQTPVRPASSANVVATIRALPADQSLAIAFPLTPEPGQDARTWTAMLREEGFVRLQIDATQLRLDEPLPASFSADSKLWVLVDRVVAGQTAVERLWDAIETAFTRGQGRLTLLSDQQTLSFDRRWQCAQCNTSCPEPQSRLLDCNDPLGACPTCAGAGHAKKSTTCADCQGRRWNKHALSLRWQGQSIADLSALTIKELTKFVAASPVVPESQLVGEQLRRRLAILMDVELGHLAICRPSASLSVGESQRLQLCAGCTNNLVGALYLLDEPAASLHARDRHKVLGQIQTLVNAGSTVIMVEHDADFIRAAEHVIDLGPGAGEEGGLVVFQGQPAALAASEDSVTGEYLASATAIPVPDTRRKPTGWLHVHGAKLHNLQNVFVDIPLGVMCAVTGVSGAGKSSLIEHTLVPLLGRLKGEKRHVAPPDAEVRGANQVTGALLIDQNPLPRSSRSNAATYLKILDDIRELFAETADAKIRGFGAGHFSFNQPGGRCDACEGQGTLAVDMHFLADVTMTCPECFGARFKKQILDIKVRSLSIAEVLKLTVREAFRFFRAQRGIEAKLKWLIDVGLDYLRLGQPTDTLSGGECQRLRLAGHLASNRKPRCLFILLEPSAGLHPADTHRLLDCFDRLLSTGHSLIAIEHILDVIKCADYVIDLGPGAGPDGGKIVAQGTPEQVAQIAASATGKFLRPLLMA